MGRFLNVTIGYEMEEEEMLKILRENCMSKEEFETEDAAYELQKQSLIMEQVLKLKVRR